MLKDTNAFRWLSLKRRLWRFRRLSADEFRALGFFQEFIRPGDLVFDVGANMGSRTKVFLELGARVVAVEPQAACVEFLSAALGRNGRFSLVEAALGAEEGQAEMRIAEAHGISTLSENWIELTQGSGRFGSMAWPDRQTVRVRTLASVIQEFGKPSFMKVDVEGFEYDALSTLTGPIPFVSFEFASENIEGAHRCIEHLESVGMSLFQYSEGESFEFSLPTWVSANEMVRVLRDRVQEDPLAWGDVYVQG